MLRRQSYPGFCVCARPRSAVLPSYVPRFVVRRFPFKFTTSLLFLAAFLLFVFVLALLLDTNTM